MALKTYQKNQTKKQLDFSSSSPAKREVGGRGASVGLGENELDPSFKPAGDTVQEEAHLMEFERKRNGNNNHNLRWVFELTLEVVNTHKEREVDSIESPAFLIHDN